MNLLSRLRKAFAPEPKSLAYPSPELEALFGVAPGTVALSDALAVPAVANAIQLISEAVASLDIHVKRIDGKDEIDVPGHPVLGLLRDEPNEWTSGFEFIRELVRDALTADVGGLAWVNRVNDQPREIIRYRYGILHCNTDTNTGERQYKLSDRDISSRDVIHLLPPMGRAPLTLARKAIAISIALDQHADGLFSNGARPGSVVKVPKAWPRTLSGRPVTRGA